MEKRSQDSTARRVVRHERLGPVEAALFNVAQKMTRLQSLRENGHMNDPANEAVADTYLDLAVYAILAFALSRQDTR